MDPFSALSEAYRKALGPFSSVEQLRRLSEVLPDQVARLNACIDPLERVKLVEAMTREMAPSWTPMGTLAAAGFQTALARHIAEKVDGRSQPLSLADCLRLITDCAEAVYQGYAHQEAFAQSIAEAWRFWPPASVIPPTGSAQESSAQTAIVSSKPRHTKRKHQRSRIN